MFEKLRISLIFINLVLFKSLSLNHRMHNLYTKFVRILEICKQFSHNLVNAQGNIVRRGPVPRFSDLEVVALSLAAESESIDSENCFLSTNCKNTRKKFQILYHADNSMTVGRKQQRYLRVKSNGFPLKYMVRNSFSMLVPNLLEVSTPRKGKTQEGQVGKSFPNFPVIPYYIRKTHINLEKSYHAVCGLIGIIHFL